MAGVHIVVDSTTALPRSAAQDLGVSIVTHNASVDGRPFHGTDLADPVFYDALRSAGTAPRIHPPTAEDFLEVYRRVLGWGVELISLHPPRALSDSVSAARAAAERLPRDAPLSIVETAWIGSALGLVAARAAEAGIDDWPRRDVLGLIDGVGGRLNLVGVAGDRAYLDRYGGLLNALGDVGDPDVAGADGRTIFECRDGGIQPLHRVPSLGDALRRLVREIEERAQDAAAVHLALFSAGADAEAAAVATFLEPRMPTAEVWIAACDPVLAGLVGPGSFGVAFYTD